MAQDVTYNITSSSDYPYLCDNSTPCSDYSYLIVESNSSVANNASLSITAHKNPTGSFFNYLVPLRSKYIIFDITNFDLTASNFKDLQVTSYSNFTSGTITLTLTDKTPTFSTVSGTLDITENGSYDVTNYAQVDVVVPATEIPGDYHDDLVNINQSILICGAVLLVLYFFYCIYRLIIKNTGGS